MNFLGLPLFSCAALLAMGSSVPLAAQEKTDAPAGESAVSKATGGAEKSAENGPALKSPADTAPQTRRAIAAMRAGQWKAARESWESVLRVEPENAAALSNLGKVLYQLEDYPAAQTALEKATALKPELTDSWLTLGLTYLARGAPMRAVSSMTRGVSENPADPRAHNSLAIVLKRIGWTDGAEAELQKALDLNPEYSEAHFNLAVMYLERKPPSLAMAKRHYDRACALGAEPDPIVEKQLRGETVIDQEESGGTDAGDEETEETPAPPKTLGADTSAKAKESGGDAKNSPDAPSAKSGTKSGGSASAKKSPPRKPSPPSSKSSRKSS